MPEVVGVLVVAPVVVELRNGLTEGHLDLSLECCDFGIDSMVWGGLPFLLQFHFDGGRVLQFRKHVLDVVMHGVVEEDFEVELLFVVLVSVLFGVEDVHDSHHHPLQPVGLVLPHCVSSLSYPFRIWWVRGQLV
jgi:hypothetical protein